jgi:uncharacterized protein (UPF0335 family)
MTAAQPNIGHNSSQNVADSGARLKSFIERVERLEEEKRNLAEDIKEVYAEAKATGFEPKIIRKMVSIRRANLEKRREEQQLLEVYAAAIQMDLF